jgi:uncharacterized membrane protein YfcA
MAEIDPVLLVLLVLATFAGAISNGLIGMGMALFVVNVLAAALGSKNAVVAMSIISPVTSGYQLWLNRGAAGIIPRILPVLAGAFVGSLVGAQLLVILPAWVISFALGLFTIQFVVDQARHERPQMTGHRERMFGPFAGFVSGTTNGAIGASGPVIGSFLLAIGLRAREFVFGISLVFLFQGITRGSLFFLFNQYSIPVVVTAVALLAPALVGQQVGLRLRGRLDAKMFRRVILLVLFVSSLNLVLRGLDGAVGAARESGLLGGSPPGFSG